MSGEQQQQHDQGTRTGGVDQRRRRLTTAAAMAVPAFFVLRHRSGAAASDTSTGGSATARVAPRCSGRSPGYWRNHPAHWPAGCEPGSPRALAGEGGHDAGNGTGYLAAASVLATRSDVIFDGGTRFFDVAEWGDYFQVAEPERLTLMGVLRLRPQEDPHGLGAYFVAALLNANSGLTEPVPAHKVQEMWRQWVHQGYYAPPPGVDRWYAADIKRYFETTWA